MAKKYRVKSLMRERSGYPCYVVRTKDSNGGFHYQWAHGGNPPSKLPPREAMGSLMNLKRRVPTYEWELEVCDD